MSWAGFRAALAPPTEDVYVGTRGVGRIGNAGAWGTAAEGLEHGLDMLAAALGERPPDRRACVRLWLSGGLCRPFLTERPDGLTSEAEFERLTIGLVSERTGFGSQCRVWIERHRSAQRAIAVAADDAALLKCEHVLGRHYRRIAAAQPWWSEALAFAEAPRAQTVFLRDCDSVTVFAGVGQRCDFATTYAPVLDDLSAQALWLRTRGAGVGTGTAALNLRLDPRSIEGPSVRPGRPALKRWMERVS